MIKNEYSDIITPVELLDIIQNRSWERKTEVPAGYKSLEDFHRSNQSKDGPSGLMRSRLNDRCIKNGDGTWDCFVGIFS